MFTIDTSSTRWRRVATTGLALPMAFMLSGTALASGPSTDLQLDSVSGDSSSTAKMTIDVDCFTVAVTSDKDISNVKVTFADGSFQEIERISGYSFNRTFPKAIASATSKSGTTTVADEAGSCTAPVEEEQPPVEDETPVVDETPAEEELPVEEAPVEETPVEEAPEDDDATQGNGTANMSIEVDCRTIRIVSDKDISNVKVSFADGSFQEINGLSGYAFDRTFAKDIASATSKSATTTVADDAGSCSAPVEETPAEETPAVETPEDEAPADEDEAPVCPTNPVMGPVMEGCETAPVEETPAEETPVQETPVQEAPVQEAPVQETPADNTPIVGQPAPQPATGGGTAAEETPAEETPAEETPAEETPAEETPVAEAPAEQAPVQEATPISGQPAAAPAMGVVNTGAVAPVVVKTAPANVEATPTALPFTGANAELLAGLGSLLFLAGGGAAVAGRRERVAQTA